MATHSRILAWRISWTRSLVGYSPQCHMSRTWLKLLSPGQHSRCGPCFSKARRLDRTLGTHRTMTFNPNPENTQEGASWRRKDCLSRDVPWPDASCQGVYWERRAGWWGRFSRGEDCRGLSCWRGQSLSHGVPEWRSFLERQTEWAQDPWYEVRGWEKASWLLLPPFKAAGLLIRHFCGSRLSLSLKTARIIDFIKV